MKSSVRGGPLGSVGEKVVLYKAVFVMSRLRPRIGKEDKEAVEGNAGRNDFEEQPGLGMKKVEIGQARAVAFPQRSFDTLTHNIDPDAELIGMSFRIGGQVMPMSAADLPRERQRLAQEGAELLPKIEPALRHALAIFDRTGGKPGLGVGGVHPTHVPHPLPRLHTP